MMTWTGEDSERNRTAVKLVALTFSDSNGYGCKFLNKDQVDPEFDEYGLLFELETK